MLRSGDGGPGARYEHNVRVTSAEDIVGIMARFNGGIDFSDAPTGFFGFLRDTFAALAREERAVSDADEYPSFGHRQDSFVDVVRPFYSAWSAFATRKTFSWKDAHRYSDAPDRRYRRLMEKENKRLRDEGIREFNDAVRSLVAFVRRRDPRYVPSTQTEAERQMALRDAAAAQAARSRAANEARLKGHVPEWTKSKDSEDLSESEESEIEEQLYECVACQKIFKSENQYEVHEKSKKHLKAVQTLSRRMQAENKHIHDVSTSTDGSAPTPQQEQGKTATEGGDAVSEEDKLDVTEQLRGASIQTGEGVSGSVAMSQDNNIAWPSPEHSESDRQLSSDVDVDIDADVGTLAQDSSNPPIDAASFPQKRGKAAQKRAKRAAQKAATEQSVVEFKCMTCNANFPSRTRLFQHIKDFGHATASQATAKAPGKPKTKR